MLAKVSKAKAAAKPTVADLAKKGDAIADAAEIAAAKAKLEAAGFSVKEKKARENVIPEMVAELKAVVAKHGGVDVAAVKATFVAARKQLWPISAEQRAYNKAQAEKRKAKAEAK
jgi:hypothetical protein